MEFHGKQRISPLRRLST